MKYIQSQALEFTYMASKQDIKYNYSIKPIKWIPPQSNYFKLNIDGAVSPSTGKAGVGGIIRDSNGNRLFGFSGNITNTSSVHAEL